MRFNHKTEYNFLINGGYRQIQLKVNAVIKGVNRKNIYCKMDDGITCIIVKADQIAIVDSKWVDELSKLRFFFKKSRRECGYFRCRFKCKDGKWRDIQLGKVVCDLESGIVSGLNAKMQYPYDGKECHHKWDRLDNRAGSLESLTKEEHGMRGRKSNNKIKLSISNEDYELLLETCI